MVHKKDDDNLTLCVPRPSSGQNPHQPVIVRSPKPEHLLQNHVLIEVDRFGFSANNVTYQALGEAPHFRYFDFHPAPTSDTVSPKTHGIIPVWGFGTIISSTHPRIQAGERVYGYLAPTRYLLLPVSPSDVNKYAFFAPRPQLPADRRPYNQITRCSSDPQYDPSPAVEDLTMLYRPLFWTSYWCEDWLFSSKYRGATNILISSASSKTAFCLAYLIKKRIAGGELKGVTVVGVTSKGNLAFTKGLSLYDEILEYDILTSAPSLAKSGKWLYVDVAGNDSLNSKIFSHLGSRLVAGVALGLTNLSPSAPDASSTKWSTNTFDNTSTKTSELKELEQFFMPEWLAIRRHQMTIPQITGMQGQAWKELMRDCTGWVKMGHVKGGEEVKRAYENVAKGGLGPDKGMIWSLWDEDAGSEGRLSKL